VQLDPQRLASIIAVAIILLVSFPVHEFSHALAAFRLGDGTAKLFGRLTLNPIAHFDPLGGLMLIFTGLLSQGFAFGWAKPTPVNPMNLRGGRESEAIVALAGPASNLVLAIAAALPLRFIINSPIRFEIPSVVTLTLGYFVLINLALAIFNLIPVPPLDGSKVLFAFLPARTVWQWRPMLDQYGFFILLLLIIPLGPSGSILNGIFDAILLPLFNLLVGQ
jgi:Zn-dependent protease